MDIISKLENLKQSALKQDADAVQDIIFSLSPLILNTKFASDEVIDFILELLEDPFLYDKDIAGHLLNFFEFESKNLSIEQKKRAYDWVVRNSKNFTSILGGQVIAELEDHHYLRIKDA
ncbi:hypothetical protein [Aquipseudomonas alcaligenes]|uniref:Immunity protein 30 domain-containing protein n=1 Tax=Aquipseudomonas alcaligenes TaxID=43263 RepID=A0A1N6RWV7_AQUAC|nr:hypothetical protein [Pseudomonas alcaligenes]SIQ33318.1 hypothetical protein SAMN05878282_103220 [Pseudomonas alcaligenes]